MKKTILTAVITTLITLGAVHFIGKAMCGNDCKSKCTTEASCKKSKCDKSKKECTKGKTCTKGEKSCKPGCEKKCCKKEKSCEPGCIKSCCATKSEEDSTSTIEDVTIDVSNEIVEEITE